MGIRVNSEKHTCEMVPGPSTESVRPMGHKIDLGTVKSQTIKILANLFYRLGFLKIMNRLVDRVQQRKGKEGYIQFPFIQRRVSRTLQILMYHGVSDAESPYLPSTSTHVFQTHMQYLAKSCHVLDLQEAIERIESHDLPERAVVVTLDDGYRDNYLHVFPVLKQLGITATIFLATGVIGNSRVLWHDHVCRMISQTSARKLNNFGSVGGYALDTREGKRRAQDGVLWFLRSLKNEERMEKIQSLSLELEVPDVTLDSELMLNWSEIKEMYRAGIRFGAHTVTHPILSRLSLDEVVQELRQSKETIEQELQETISTFAYPSGRSQDFNAEIKEIVKQEGFRCAVSTMAGSNRETDDIFEMKRIGFWDQDLSTFGLRFEYFRFCA